jgi:hypothetical protein
MSLEALCRNAERAVLFTDVDNRTSHALYQRIGYRPSATTASSDLAGTRVAIGDCVGELDVPPPDQVPPPAWYAAMRTARSSGRMGWP